MSKASIQAFIRGIKNGKIQSSKIELYKFIRDNPNSTIKDLQINFELITYSTITARLSDLTDLGVIKPNGITEHFTRYVIVTNKKEQHKLFSKREKEKKRKYIRTLIESFGHTMPFTTIELLKKELVN